MANKLKEHDNTLVLQYLENVSNYQQACAEYCFFNDIATGTANLDAGGNTRPLSKTMLFDIISSLPVISSKTVQARTGLSRSHAARVAMFSRILSKAFEMHIRNYREIPTIIPWVSEYADAKEFAADDRLQYHQFLLSKYN